MIFLMDSITYWKPIVKNKTLPKIRVNKKIEFSPYAYHVVRIDLVEKSIRIYVIPTGTEVFFSNGPIFVDKRDLVRLLSSDKFVENFENVTRYYGKISNKV